jgi:hypothetical protein
VDKTKHGTSKIIDTFAMYQVHINVVAGLLRSLDEHWYHNELPLHAQPRRHVIYT